MAKLKTTFFCQNCGAQSPKWIGKCSYCNEWNTYVEEMIQKGEKTNGRDNIPLFKKKRANKPQPISEISLSDEHRSDTYHNQLNRVLGWVLLLWS